VTGSVAWAAPPNSVAWQNGPMHKRRLRQPLRLAAVAIAVAVSVSACGTSTQTPTLGPSPAARPSAEPDQVTYARIESQVEAIRGLQRTSTVTPDLLDSAGVRDWLTKANTAQTNHVALANETKLFVHLGLLPAGSDLEQMELDLQAGQVVGFYDPLSKGLYILSDSGGVGPVQKITFSHEYTHALQDQVFGLDKLAIDTTDQGDRDLARTALVEGDATLAMTLWSTKNMSIPDLLAVVGDSSSAAQTDQLAKAPTILRESLLFPYMGGLAFVQSMYDKGGWAAVDQLYANPPDSTAQILHPDLYSKKVKPVAVSVPAVPTALSGWKLTMQDTLGELQLRIWLEGENPSTVVTTAAASTASAWAGDRAGLYEGPNGAWAVVLKTQWGTAAGATAFANAVPAALKGLGPSKQCDDSTHLDIAISSSQAVLPALLPCLKPSQSGG
jgi:hypothetical protein